MARNRRLRRLTITFTLLLCVVFSIFTPASWRLLSTTDTAAQQVNKIAHRPLSVSDKHSSNTSLSVVDEIQDVSRCNLSVLILGYHLSGWEGIPRSRDRVIECPSLDMCVQAHFSDHMKDLFNFNIVMFSHLFMEIRNFKSSAWFRLLKRRPRDQRWVMFSLEPPVRVGLNTSVPKRARKQSFHWTSTYDLRSDVPLPYGRFEKLATPKRDEFDTKGLLQNKTKNIVFVSSNCDKVRWPRTKFVRTLQHYVTLDMFGKCGDAPCGNNCSDVMKQYKFILALENAPCRGYITEKFWNALNLYRAVPIVFGPLREDYEAIAPPGSFIHVYDFPSVLKLAEYINYIDKNDTAYLEYHSWRNTGNLHSIVRDWSKLPLDDTFCEIASRYDRDRRRMIGGDLPTFRDVNGADWLETCRVHAIRPRGSMYHIPIPAE